jgi:hypothetical protein
MNGVYLYGVMWRMEIVQLFAAFLGEYLRLSRTWARITHYFTTNFLAFSAYLQWEI